MDWANFTDAINIVNLITAGLFTIATFVLAYLAYTIQKRQPWAQALFEIVKFLESDDVRHIRHDIIYKCPKDSGNTLEIEGIKPHEAKQSIDKWGMYMDMISLLYESKQLNNKLFFDMYGDVIIRTAYKLSSYAVAERKIRGDQFWLPFQRLVVDFLQFWKKYSRKSKYPLEMGIPGEQDKVTIQFFLNNQSFQTFIQANNIRNPRWLKKLR
ncbi:MAG TPA: hypothetical protein VHP63_04010 [candidate division Zixibacteria bacterium]|nr:hypothetical protein [candidate division Zixibacteria bacterium]